MWGCAGGPTEYFIVCGGFSGFSQSIVQVLSDRSRFSYRILIITIAILRFIGGCGPHKPVCCHYPRLIGHVFNSDLGSMTKAPFLKRHMNSYLKCFDNNFCFICDYNDMIMSHICTCRDSWAVAACAKLWHDLIKILVWWNDNFSHKAHVFFSRIGL